MIAIVIPYYNYRFFSQTLESLAFQTDKRFNVYIGDDCSPDDPGKIISKFETLITIKYKRFEYNLGQHSLSEHWNRCVALINNESWIMVLGDDDIIHNNVIENFYKNINQIQLCGSTLIRLSTIVIDENNQVISQRFLHPIKELAKYSLFRKMRDETRSSLTEYIISIQSFNEHKFKHYPLAWHSDDRAWIEFSGEKSIFTINDAIAYIRVSGYSISGNTNNMQLKREANHLFFNYLIKKNLNYTKSEFKFLINNFVHFLKLNNNFNVKVFVFIITTCIQNLYLKLAFSTANKIILYKIRSLLKIARYKLKQL